MEELAYEAVNKVYAKDDTGPYDCLRYVSLRGFSKDSMWLPGGGWVGGIKIAVTHTQSSHPMECICQCIVARTRWPPECSAGERYSDNN